MQPLTALDALFEAPFPSYQALDKHAEDGELPLLAWAEIDDENYEGMREMLASRMDRDVVRRVGECANQRGGVQAMRGVYYTFLFALSVLSFHLFGVVFFSCPLFDTVVYRFFLKEKILPAQPDRTLAYSG